MNKFIFLLILFIPALSGCSGYKIDPPSGFASLKKQGIVYYFSPDGIKMKIRSFPNKPERDSEFWANVLKTNLEKKGYRLFKSSENYENRITNYWIITHGKEYFIYMTSVYSDSRNILLIEAAGEKKMFEKYSDKIEASVNSVFFRN